MATPLAPAPAPLPARVHGMCLLHADFHPMTGTCWTATADFFFGCQDLPEQQARNLYQLEVERAMLDKHIREHLPHLPGDPR